MGPFFRRCRQAQGRRIEDGLIAVPAQGVDGFDRSDVIAVLAEDRRIAQAQEGAALAGDDFGRDVADGHDGVDFLLYRLVVGSQFFLHDIAQVVEEGFRVGQARDHPGLGRRLFQRDRTGDGRAQAVVVQIELHCIVMAPGGRPGRRSSRCAAGYRPSFDIRHCPYSRPASSSGRGRLW